MPAWTINSSSGESAVVVAGSWLVALGMGLEVLGEASDLDRLACEVLPPGKVIARDTRTGHRWVVTERPSQREPGRRYIRESASRESDEDPVRRHLPK